ncbi:MAG: carbon monoxide dehydrogenase [Desulfotalea sp.]
MKIAFAGKGGVGKSSLASWTGDYLARKGKNVWMIDADTALSLGEASGIRSIMLPEPLILREDLIKERIHANGFLNLNPKVNDLPEKIAIDMPYEGDDLEGAGDKRLIVMGAVTNAGGGCACAANALLKAVLAHLVVDREDWVIVDLEAGVEHLGRGTVGQVDALVIVSEPSKRSLDTASEVSRMASDLGLDNQALVLNRSGHKPQIDNFTTCLNIPTLTGLVERQLTEGSVLNLPEQLQIDSIVKEMITALKGNLK